LPIGKRPKIFTATLTHPPELCPAGKEIITKYRQQADGMNDPAKEPGITVCGANVW